MNIKYLIFAVFLSVLLCTKLQGQNASRYALEDAVILEAFPDSVFQRPNNNLFAYRHDIDGALKRVQSYLSFDITGFKGKQIESASLSYRGKTGEGDYSDQFEIDLYSLKDALFTDGLTWNSKPRRDKKLGTSLLNTNSERKAFLNEGNQLLDYINESIRNGKDKVSFMILSSGRDSTDNMWIGGAEDGTFGPILEFTIAPRASQYAIEDAVVLQAHPDSVYARPNNNLFAYREDVEGELNRVMSFMKFDISHLQGYQVESANLSYRGKTGLDDFTDKFEIELLGLKDDFTPEGITWSTKPRNDKVVAKSILNTSSARKDFINEGSRMVEYINEAIRKGDSIIGFAIRSAGKDTTNNMWIGGANDGSFGPILDYTIAPNGSQYALEDAVVLQGYPDSVYARPNNNLFAYRENIEGELKRVMSFVKFEIGHLHGSQVETASFSYRGKTGLDDFADEFEIELLGLKDDFSPQGLTWNTKPRNDKLLAKSLLNISSARKDFINDGSSLIDYINEAIRLGKTTVGFAVRSAGKDTTTNMWIGGSGDGSFGPILDYTISPASSSYGQEDAVVLQAYPDSVYARSNNNVFAYRENIDGELKRVMSFVKFDISNIETDIESAKFSYRGKAGLDDYANQFELELLSLKDDFSPEGMTWNTKPRNDKILAKSILNTSSARKDFINEDSRMVDYINEAIRRGDDQIGFGIRSAGKDSTNNMWIGGVNDGSFGPILEIGLPNPFILENDTLSIIEDVYVSHMEPDSNFETGDADMHLILDTTNMASKEIYLKFNISQSSAGVGEATLWIRGAQNDPPIQDGDFFIQVFGTESDAWSEEMVTWNSKPPTTTEALTEYNINFTSSKFMDLKSVDLTSYVNQSISESRGEITFVIKGKDETTFRSWIASDDWAAGAAYLTLDYTFQEKTVLEDSYVAESSPDENYNGTTAMQVAKDSVAENDRETFFKFNLDGARSNVITANLIIRANQENSGVLLDDFFIQLYGVTDNSWDETTLTWANKPSAAPTMLLEYNIMRSAGSKDHELNSPELTEFIKETIRSNSNNVSFVFKAKDETPGSNVWISDQGWRPAKLFLDYRKVVSDPVFVTPLGDYVPEITVEISAPTPGSSIYYTTDGSDPSENSNLYDGGIQLTDTTTIRAIAIAPGLANSEIVEATYNVAPVGVPVFSPNPQIEYQNSVNVTIDLVPSDAFIVYSSDGGDPLTPYPDEGILLSETTTIRARGISADGNFFGPIIEATYIVVNTVAGTGTGPAGVGASDNTIAGQPENPLWLSADAIEGASNGEEIFLWGDKSGNGNDALNTFIEGGDNAIPNTGESQKPAPIFIENGLNGHPILQFGASADALPNRGSLIIDDADNLDGGAGISLFMVIKRNQLLEDFAAIFQKRDIRGGDAAQAYVLEFNGGSNPNKMQFVIERQLFLRNDLEINADDYYILNVELQESFGDVLFRTNGVIEKVNTYNNIIPAVDAPVIVGGFQPMDIAEVIMYKKGLNEAQNLIVHNYLAAKYNLEIGESGNGRLYQNMEFINELIGVGKTLYIDAQTEQEHRSASGGGLQIDVRSQLNVEDFVMAAHNGSEVTNSSQWERHWNLEVVGSAPNVTLSFNFEAVGSDIPSNVEDFKLFYYDGSSWSDLGLEGTLNEGLVEFRVDGIQSGEYALGMSNPSTNTGDIDLSGSLKVFPNPVTTGQVVIELGNKIDGQMTIQLFDLMGRLIYSEQDSKGGFFYQKKLNFNKIPEGVYTLKILQNGRYQSVQKLVIH